MGYENKMFQFRLVLKVLNFQMKYKSIGWYDNSFTDTQ